MEPRTVDRDDDSDPGKFLPLRPVEFQILLSLARRERHGYGIMKDAEERTGGEVAPQIGTLYRALQRMVEAGLVEPAERRPAGELDDERRNYYRVTPAGRRVAEAEARRLASLLRAAAAGGLIDGPGS